MKRFSKIGIGLVSLMMGVCFVACDKDDEFLGDKNSPFYVTNLAGKWEVTWSKGTKTQESETTNWDEAKNGFYLVFDKDRTGYNYSDQDSLKKYFLWKIQDNKLSIKMQSDEKFQTTTIDTITDQKLVLSIERLDLQATESYRKIAEIDSIIAQQPVK